MAEITIAGIMRAGAFSPNHIGNDAAIFNETADQLRKRGCVVNTYSEEQFNATGGKLDESIILSMCREQRSIKNLQRLEDEGRLVINSAYGIENCSRERMTRILLGNGIPYPESIIVNTNEVIRPMLEKQGFKNCWIKRGDFPMHKEDITFVRHAEEAQEVLQEYFLRGIKRAVINIHLTGDLVKFYGIKDSNFFFWFYPFDDSASKWAAEPTGGKPRKPQFNEQDLKAMCNRAATELNVEIYGGDCIVNDDGDFTIIDFNDWPSFAPCRREAPAHIAKHILRLIKEHR